jgi:glycosyltransferase involved in cell wall biosynthesis
MKKIKIATILPYKENYTFSNAQAAALWVSHFFKYTKFKDTNFIYGNTNTKDYLTKNYFNIKIYNKSSRFSSTTSEYCTNFIKSSKIFFDIIEIHNRPLVFSYLKKSLNSKFILYFHNDPLQMKGSKKTAERLMLINQVDKIVFISKWVRSRFFKDIDDSLINKTAVVYHSIDKERKIYKKEKNIVFVGKLNRSKGYDIYGEAIIRILDKFKNWNSFSIGDELKNKENFNHERHKELGFQKHKDVLNFLRKSEIAVIPSRWEEPFGRTALEASSRACATIVSNKGGLPETTAHSIILKELNSNQLFLSIKKLIENTKLRKSLQKKGFSNVQHDLKKNSKLIDDIRVELTTNYKLNISRNKLRIINIYNLGQKLNHRLYNISLGKKFTNGFIRNNHDVLEISDRDFIRQNKLLLYPNPQSKFQEYLIESFKNYNPDLVFFGHSNNINSNTVSDFKKINNNIIISQWNEDPVMPSLEYSKSNIKNIAQHNEYVDHNFITTDPKIFTKKKPEIKNLNFFFVPVDPNIECYNVTKLKPNNDLFYAMSHGVNRATLKKGKIDGRVIFLDKLIKNITKIRYDFYGYKDREPIWGDSFYNALINSKMGLNLSRGLPTKYYTSNRIASLMGNGLLTFVDKKTKLSDFFSNKEIVNYTDISDLSEKILFYQKNDKARIKIANNGRSKYFKLFNETRVAKYIIDISLGKNAKLI